MADIEPYIDGHSHIWTPDVAHYPLAAGFTVADMQPRSFTAEELLGICRPAEVGRRRDRIIDEEDGEHGRQSDPEPDGLLEAVQRDALHERHPGVVDHRERHHLDAGGGESPYRLRGSGARAATRRSRTASHRA